MRNTSQLLVWCVVLLLNYLCQVGNIIVFSVCICAGASVCLYANSHTWKFPRKVFVNLRICTRWTWNRPSLFTKRKKRTLTTINVNNQHYTTFHFILFIYLVFFWLLNLAMRADKFIVFIFERSRLTSKKCWNFLSSLNILIPRVILKIFDVPSKKKRNVVA